jgi:hypothetical protein
LIFDNCKVHFARILLLRPCAVFRSRTALRTFFSALRSATFLATFVSSFWLAVCGSRTLVLARLFPQISHNFWDGPHGCILAGCLVCGGSIWIEKDRRRGEIALYVLPRAVMTCLPNAWLRGRNKVATIAERSVCTSFGSSLSFTCTITQPIFSHSVAFVVSLASLLTAATHYPDSMRGLSHWTLAFIITGPNTNFWKRKQRSVSSIPPTPSIPSTPSSSASKSRADN